MSEQPPPISKKIVIVQRPNDNIMDLASKVYIELMFRKRFTEAMQWITWCRLRASEKEETKIWELITRHPEIQIEQGGELPREVTNEVKTNADNATGGM